MSQTPLLSIVAAVYNGEKFLAHSLRALSNSSWKAMS
jgi:glycosyltransferase involved in cell wall biosynthesis